MSEWRLGGLCEGTALAPAMGFSTDLTLRHPSDLGQILPETGAGGRPTPQDAARKADAMPVQSTPRVHSSYFIGRTLLAGLFVLNVCLLIYLNLWKVGGVPVRSLMTGLLFTICFFFYWREFHAALIRYRLVYLFLLVTSLIAIAVSYINKNPPEAIVSQIIEAQLQGFLNFTIVAVLVQVLGLRFVAYTLIGVIAVSTLMAVLQYLGVSPAWELRLAMAHFMKDEIQTISELTNQSRAPGLSLNAVVYATDLCLVFAVFWGLRQVETNGALFDRVDIPVMVAVVLFLAASFITGNRSPILGMVIFAAIYLLMTNRLALLLVPVGIVSAVVILPVALEILESTGLRVFSTEDKSAVGRAPLRDFGIILFLDRPIGYGLAFDPRDHWEQHWSALSHYENASIITRERLHNYFLNIINKYGVLLVFPAAFGLYYMGRHWRSCFPFIVYIVHIFYHNAGPLQGNALLWLVIPTLPVIIYETVYVRQDEENAAPLPASA